MANRYDSFDNGSPTEDRLKFSKTNVGYSAHNFSCTHAGNYVLGMLAPIDCFDVVPSEKLDMSISAVLEFRNPTTRKLFNGFRTFFHSRYNRFIDLWEGGRNFIDHGRTGKIDLSRPNAIFTASDSSVTDTVCSVDANTPLSLLNFLGLPASSMQEYIDAPNEKSRIPLRQFQTAFSIIEQVDGGSVSVKSSKIGLGFAPSFFPADCLMAYQRNWRDFYANKNLLQNNKYWFPDNEDHFILSYSCTNAVCINYENEALDSDYERITNLLGEPFDSMVPGNLYTPEPNNPATSSDVSSKSIHAPNLAGIKFVQMRGDRFTTASPFPDLIRGDIPTLQLTEDNFVRYGNISAGEVTSKIPINGLGGDSSSPILESRAGSGGVSFRVSVDDSNFDHALLTPDSSVTMSDLYTLETLTAFKRKMGMTNGDYNESIEAMFGKSPRVHDRRGTYVGGFYVDWNQDSVIQQSESGTTPLGTKAGNGQAAGSGSIGHFEVPDFGWIQTYMFTVSDVYYTQGKPRQYSKSESIDLYFPLFNNLPAQAIRNDELYITGDSSDDALPFAYEDRYAEYKGRHNRVSGFMGLSHDVAAFDASRIMARRFSSVPSLNSQFVTYLPENTDMDVFAVNDEPPIDFNIAIQVRRVFPGPYMAIEGSLSSPALN